VSRATSALVSAVLACAVAVGALTSGFSGASASTDRAHHIVSESGSGTDSSGDGLRNPSAPVPRVVAGLVTVGPLRILHPLDTALVSTTDRPLPATGSWLATHETGSPHDPPHLHAFSLRI
jgi:hypothetical protein